MDLALLKCYTEQVSTGAFTTFLKKCYIMVIFVIRIALQRKEEAHYHLELQSFHSLAWSNSFALKLVEQSIAYFCLFSCCNCPRYCFFCARVCAIWLCWFALHNRISLLQNIEP